MSNEYSDRLRVLEEKFEYQELTIDTLNDVIIDQQKQLAQLSDQIRILKSQMSATQDEKFQGEDPPPPHY